MINCSDIRMKPENNYPEHTSQTFMTLSEYLEAAERAIMYWMPKIKPSLTIKLSKDEDAIAFVAYAMMIADWKWRDDGGRTPRSYRNDYASYALRTLVKRQSHTQKYQYLEDELGCDYSTGKHNLLKDTIVDSKAEDPLSILIGSTKQNRLNRIRDAMDNKVINERERHCLKEYYYNDKTCLEIGKSLGVSKQRIHQSILKAKDKLKSIV